MGVSQKKLGVPYFGVLIIRILLCRVLYWGPLLSETPTWDPTVEDLEVEASLGGGLRFPETPISLNEEYLGFL